MPFPDHIADHESESSKYEWDIAYQHETSIQKSSIEILYYLDEWIFEGVERGKKWHEKLFLFIDDIYSGDREDTSEEESESDIFIEEDISKQGREDQLEIGSKTRKKWTRYCKEFLNEKIKYYRSNNARHEDIHHPKSGEMLKGIGSRNVFGRYEYECTDKSTKKSSEHHLHRSIGESFWKHEVWTIAEYCEYYQDITIDWSDIESWSIKLGKEKYESSTDKCQNHSKNLSFFDHFMKEEIGKYQGDEWCQKVDHLCDSDIGLLDPISVEDTIDSDTESDRYDNPDIFPWFSKKMVPERDCHDDRDNISKKAECPRRDFSESIFRSDSREGTTESYKYKEKEFLHEKILWNFSHHIRRFYFVTWFQVFHFLPLLQDSPINLRKRVCLFQEFSPWI